MNLKYALHWHIHIYQFIPYTRILKPFEDSEPTGLKVDIAHLSLSLTGLASVGVKHQNVTHEIVRWCLMS